MKRKVQEKKEKCHEVRTTFANICGYFFATNCHVNLPKDPEASAWNSKGALTIVCTPVAGERGASSSVANIPHIQEKSDGEIERQRSDNQARRPSQCLRSGSVYEALPR